MRSAAMPRQCRRKTSRMYCIGAISSCPSRPDFRLGSICVLAATFTEFCIRMHCGRSDAAVRALEQGPAVMGAKARDDIRPGLQAAARAARDHVSRGRGRRVDVDPGALDIARCDGPGPADVRGRNDGHRLGCVLITGRRRIVPHDFAGILIAAERTSASINASCRSVNTTLLNRTCEPLPWLAPLDFLNQL